MTNDDLKQTLAGLRQATMDLLAAREQAIGRPSVSPAALEAARALRESMRPLATVHSLNGEARGVAMLDWMIGHKVGVVAEFLGDDEVDAIRPEFRLDDRWRVDRAVFHRSGRISLIEVKDGASPREVVAGIGQALLYKAIAERTLSHSPIMPALAVLSDWDEDIARACSLAGVDYLPMGDVAWVRNLSELASVLF